MGRGLDGFFCDARVALCSFEGPGAAVSRRFPVALARGKHLFPFRTEQLSPSAPMVLGSRGPGRVGRRRSLTDGRPPRPPVACWPLGERSVPPARLGGGTGGSACGTEPPAARLRARPFAGAPPASRARALRAAGGSWRADRRGARVGRGGARAGTTLLAHPRAPLPARRCPMHRGAPRWLAAV